LRVFNARLSSAARDDRITDIAFGLGFTHLSRMAIADREKFEKLSLRPGAGCARSGLAPAIGGSRRLHHPFRNSVTISQNSCGACSKPPFQRCRRLQTWCRDRGSRQEGCANAAETEFRQMSANDRPLVTRKGLEDSNTAQSGGLRLITGVGPQHTPAAKLWFGKASNPPGFRSLPHHHGEAETGAYLLSGRARIYFGKNYGEYVEMSEGDFMFVPPFLPHLEANMSTTEELWWLACRTPENIVVNLPDVEDGSLAGYRRA
jgi:uncharacterized RmlC-like cupin family protein